MFFRAKNKRRETTGPWNIGYCQRSYYTDSFSKIMIFIHQILFIRPQWPTFISRSNVVSNWPIIRKYDVHKSGKIQWTMKYRSQWPTNIWRSHVGSYWLIISKYDVQPLNSFQDIRQNHSTMKYRSQFATNILRSNIGSYWLIIPNYGVYISNSLQDIR